MQLETPVGFVRVLAENSELRKLLRFCFTYLNQFAVAFDALKMLSLLPVVVFNCLRRFDVLVEIRTKYNIATSLLHYVPGSSSSDGCFESHMVLCSCL